MSGFISKSACRGRRPSQFAGFDGFQRQDLITRLLKERGVARFIVAPRGYGKTSVAIEYAETVFSWVHTFFINCQSPCFLRDLDDGPLAQACLQSDEDARLVIFDAVPPLDADRARLFSDEIDALLAAKCEVIVTCTPASDVLGQLQSDQVRLGPTDLLLTDEELESAHPFEDRVDVSPMRLSAAYRVPALAWGDGPSSIGAFLKKSFQEPMPADFLLAIASMYVLHQGSLDDLGTLGLLDFEPIGTMLDAYPHLCFDSDQERFDAPLVAVDAIAFALKGRMDMLVSRSPFESKEGLAFAWADVLMAGGSAPARACDVVRVFCPRAKRGPWVADHACDLIDVGCLYPGLRLMHATSMKPADFSPGKRAKALAFEAFGRMVLGDVPGSLSCARRCVADDTARDDVKAFGMLVISCLGAGASKGQADAFLGELAAGTGEGALSGKGFDEPAIDKGSWAIARIWWASLRGLDALAAELVVLQSKNANARLLCVGAQWLFSIMGTTLGDSLPMSFADAGAGVSAVERFVRDRIEKSSGKATDFVTASAALSMERIHMRGVAYSAGPMPTSALLDLRQVELSLLRQRQQFDSEVESGSGRAANQTDASGDSLTARSAGFSGLTPKMAPKLQRNVPVLKLKMFGRFEASIGGVPIEQKLFSRQNVRSLLVLLAINQGRELPRESVMRTMWPKSTDEVARKNFYSVWSQLKRALSLSDGTCPYLVRHQYGCALEDRYVQSDVTRFGQICRELLFGRPDFQEWSAIYTELDRDFANDLLPAELGNPLVVSARNDFRARLVDALVSATQSVVEEGNSQWGIWFARMAVSHDETREDAYVALMRAQIAGEQRTAAIMTFLKCQRVLADELGVDPSAETVALYESLLE